MLTVVWKIGRDQEEIFETASVAKIPAAPERSDQLDCGGRAHIAFQRLTAVEGDGVRERIVRTVIDIGEVFVMNAGGSTIAKYRFKPDDRPSIAA